MIRLIDYSWEREALRPAGCLSHFGVIVPQIQEGFTGKSHSILGSILRPGYVQHPNESKSPSWRTHVLTMYNDVIINVKPRDRSMHRLPALRQQQAHTTLHRLRSIDASCIIEN
jgi:hypothetical protein